MTLEEKKDVLQKLAFYGSASVLGSPAYTTPPMTVGQVLYNAGAPSSPFTGSSFRAFSDQVNKSGLNVNSPAKNLFKAGIGALAGNFLGKTLGVSPFFRGVLSTVGANYGYKY